MSEAAWVPRNHLQVAFFRAHGTYDQPSQQASQAGGSRRLWIEC